LLCVAEAHGLAKIGVDKVTAEKKSVAPNGFWKRHLDKLGVGGSLFAALCCLGFPALLSILSAIGLGFLIDDILRPLMVVFFAGRNFGTGPWYASSRKTMGPGHRNPERGGAVCVHLRLF
jgi:hypothetical protein